MRVSRLILIIFLGISSAACAVLNSTSPVVQSNFDSNDCSFQKLEVAEEYNKFYLYGEITLCTAYKFSVAASALRLENKNKPFIVEISSLGGDYYASMSITSEILYLISRGNRVITVGKGSVQSGATLVFLASPERYLYPNTTFMFHDIQAAREESGVKERLEKLRSDYHKILSNLSKIPENEIVKLFNKELLYGEVLALGLGKSIYELNLKN